MPRRRAVGRKPVQSATHSGASRRNDLVPKAGQGDQKVAAVGMAPLIEDAVGRPSALIIVIRQGRCDHGHSWALVPIASRSLSIASSTFEVPVNAPPRPSFTASTHQRLRRKPWRRPTPSEMEGTNEWACAAPQPCYQDGAGATKHRGRSGLVPSSPGASVIH